MLTLKVFTLTDRTDNRSHLSNTRNQFQNEVGTCVSVESKKKKNTISGVKPSEGHLTALGSQVLSMYEKQDTKASGDVQNNE